MGGVSGGWRELRVDERGRESDEWCESGSAIDGQREAFIHRERSEGVNFDALKPDFLTPNWKCSACGKTYWRNRRQCSRCQNTVFDRVR
ncbi:hypothetical protein [Haladaptatus sp. NG-SE-30]